MIFDKDLDKSFWCMLKIDKDNRGEMIDFVKGLPSSFLSVIRNNTDNVRKKVFSQIEFDTIYKCIINNDLSSKELTISQKRIDGSYKYLKIYSNNDVNLSSLSEETIFLLGEYGIPNSRKINQYHIHNCFNQYIGNIVHVSSYKMSEVYLFDSDVTSPIHKDEVKILKKSYSSN